MNSDGILSKKYTVSVSNGYEHSFGSLKLSNDTINVVSFKPPLYLASARRGQYSKSQTKKSKRNRSKMVCAHCQETDVTCECKLVFPVFYVFIEGATYGCISRDDITQNGASLKADNDEWHPSRSDKWQMFSKHALVCPYCERDEPISLVGWFCMEIRIDSPIDSSKTLVELPILPVMFPSSTLPRIFHKECYIQLAKEAISVGCRLPLTAATDARYKSPLERFYNKGLMTEIFHVIEVNLYQTPLAEKQRFVTYLPCDGTVKTGVEDFRTLGNEAMKKKDYDNAIKLYGIGIQQNNRDSKLYSNRAAAYAASGNHEDAYRDALKCTQKEPNWIKGHYRKALALSSLGRKEEAVESTLFALTLEPNSLEVANLLVQIEIKSGETTIKQMAEIIEEYSQCRNVHLFLSIVCQKICTCVGIDTLNDEIHLQLNKKKFHESSQDELLAGEDAVKIAKLIHDYDCPVYLDSFVSAFIQITEHEIERLKDCKHDRSISTRIKAIEDVLVPLKRIESKVSRPYLLG